MNPFLGTAITIGSSGGAYAENLNAAQASLMYAQGFIALGTSLDYFWLNVASVAGTDANRSITFELQADNSTLPSGVALATHTVTGGWTANVFRKISPSWSGISLTPGVRYWIVIKNVSVAPATDYIALNRAGVQPLNSTAAYGQVSATFVRRGWNGTNWTSTTLQHQSYLLLVYTDGTRDGLRYRTAKGYDSNYLVSPTRQVGVELTVPASAPIMNVTGVGISFSYANASKIIAYINHARVAVSPFAAEPLQLSRTVNLPLAFQAVPGDIISLLTETGSWTSLQPHGEQLFNDADFLNLKPWSACAAKLESGVWSTDQLVTPQVTLYLDQRTPFSPPPINRRQFNAQR